MMPNNAVPARQFDDRIVVYGMSCVGKTAFAQRLTSHHYYCFDAMFHWHLIELLNLSVEANFNHINATCTADKFVIDGWHLSDKEGAYLPPRSCVYVVYAPYEQIVEQYRIPVVDPEEYRAMYHRWYSEINYDSLPGTRYFRNMGDFIETTRETFLTLRSHSQ